MSRTAFIHGAGGFGREVAWLLRDLCKEPWVINALLEDEGGPNIGRTIHGIPVLCAKDVDPSSVDAVFVAVGNSAVREKITLRHQARGARFQAAVADDVRLHSSVVVGAGSIICRGTIPTVDITIGQHVHVNLDCTIGHDAVLEDYVTLAPGVHVSGFVTIERGAYIGTGANIINGSDHEVLTIGRGSTVAAGATVTKSVPANVLVAGVPAVVKKTLAG